MVANKGRFLRFGQRLMPPGRETLLDELTVATTQSFGGFIRGQFGIAALYGVVVGIIAFVVRGAVRGPIAVVTAALQSIPYFGQLVSWPPLFVTTLVFAPTALVPVTICLVVGLLVIQNIISPRVLGSAVGLNPILVLAAVFVGAQIAGAIGGVFGVPVARSASPCSTRGWTRSGRPPPSTALAIVRCCPRRAARRCGQDAILEAAEEEAAKARADLDEARDRVEELEAELKGRPVKHRDKAGPREDRPLLPSEGGEKVGQEAIGRGRRAGSLRDQGRGRQGAAADRRARGGACGAQEGKEQAKPKGS